ncbi:MAG: hypothetical protein HY608_04840 [Planctomycetes bacterium]|nr:hypothetical protein [Planctomycetota bacterium]
MGCATKVLCMILVVGVLNLAMPAGTFADSAAFSGEERQDLQGREAAVPASVSSFEGGSVVGVILFVAIIAAVVYLLVEHEKAGTAR